MTRLAPFALALALVGCSGGTALSGAELALMGAAVGCPAVVPIGLNETVSGQLDPGDCDFGDDTYADYYAFRVDDAEVVTLTLRSNDFDAYLVLYDMTGDELGTDDDSGGGSTGFDSQLTQTLSPGRYIIAANQISRENGSYTLTVSLN